MNHTLEDLVQEREWRKIAPDWDDAGTDRPPRSLPHFCSKYWWIRHPERGRIKFELFDAQIDCVRMWLTERYSVALKARQIGFSTLISTFCFWSTFFYTDRAIVMLSKTERDAVKLLEKAKYGIALPARLDQEPWSRRCRSTRPAWVSPTRVTSSRSPRLPTQLAARVGVHRRRRRTRPSAKQ